MRLLLREYLSMLRELKELDTVVADLAIAMDLKVLHSPQKGVRQDGVDVHAVGIDPEDGCHKNFLFTIKRGDIDRASWDSGPQAVRQSINEIIDAYIPRLGTKEKDLPKKILVCCGGELRQDVFAQWSGVQSANSKADVSLDLWDGNHLAGLVEKYLFNESIFFEEVRRAMRRTLVVLSDVDYDLSHFKQMVQRLLFEDNWQSVPKKTLPKQAIAVLNTLPVCLGMISKYSQENDNFKHPLLAAEHVALRAWAFIQKNGLESNRKVIAGYYRILKMYIEFGSAYFSKVQEHCYVRDGIARSCRSSVTSSHVIFEQIGILATIGLTQAYFGVVRKNENQIENAKVVANAIVALIENNGVSGSPIFDGMAIDICLAVLLLALTGNQEAIKSWIGQLVHRFRFGYVVLERLFPIGIDSMDTLLEFQKEAKYSKEEMVSCSTLLPILACWCAILGFEVEYRAIVDFVESELEKTTLQMCHVAKGGKQAFYSGYCMDRFGVSEAPITLPKSMSEFSERLSLLVSHVEQSGKFETVWNDAPPALPLISARAFRNPVVPILWISKSESPAS